ncbi:helix-turn-helix domain-containing protein [Epilithonimonas sp.]|jgi:transcriptional regulator with XRE-family HTH domain|uniref:helix-turn-helix domain-containing protein n=1 Tax=Epilithonimonas sp. TaxID=2894511 RepID=UPI0035B45184
MSRLKEIREQKNLTQEELSEKSNISVRTIQRIEAGTEPKGHTLKVLARSLDISESELLNLQQIDESEEVIESAVENEAQIDEDISKLKLINLSSVLFTVFPPLNIIAPLVVAYFMKQKNPIIGQIVSVQILWTILAPAAFFLGISLKLGKQFTLILMVAIVLSNVFIILRNTAEIEKNKKLHYRLKFNIL